jgi:hypothetical protein
MFKKKPMRHTYLNPRALDSLDSCTLFAFCVEDFHVLCIMATKYERELAI